MKIALFCTNEFSIPLRKDIIYAPLPLFENLALGLAKKGHKIFLYASSNSKIRHKNIKLISNNSISFDKAGFKRKDSAFHDQEVLTLYEQLLLSQLIKDEKKYKFDVIHIYHNLIHFLPFLNLVKTPVFFTLHDPINDKRAFILKKCDWKNKAHYISISNNQRKNFPSLNYATTIYNGIDLNLYKFNKKPADYLVYLGRVSSDKGTHLAVKAVNKAKVKLKIIGANWGGSSYWDKHIKPFWNEKTMQYLDHLPQPETRPIIANAKGFLFPIQWEEPFGLVMIEAMASGTPVIAFNKGSVKEVVKNNKTGFIVNTVGEMVEKIKQIDKIDRSDCRKHVKENFSLEKMINKYEKIYKKY